MSVQQVRVCSQILYEFFGYATQKVGDLLLREGAQNLKSIVQRTGLPGAKVKEALKLLIQHNLVKFSAKSTCSDPIYAADIRNIYFLLRLQRAFAHVHKELGPEAREILEEIVCRGSIPLSVLLFICGWKVYGDRPHKETLSQREVVNIIDKHFKTFETLTVNHYCCRCPEVLPDQDGLVPQFSVNEHLRYSVPPINIEAIADRIKSGNSNLSDLEDAGVSWKFDIDNFYREWRDEIVVNALSKRYQNVVDNNIFRILVRKTFACNLKDGLPLESPWVNHMELCQQLSRYESGERTIAALREHLDIVLTDPKCALRVEDPELGPYCVNYAAAMTHLMTELVEHIIVERHGFFAVRIFRLIRAKQYIEQDRIAEIGMIPSKEAKNLTFKLIRDNFVKVREIRKTYAATAAPSKIGYFFYVDIHEVAASLLETSFKAITNSQIRRTFEKYNYRMVLAKQERVSRILNTVRARGATSEQLQDIEDLVTPPERVVLRKAADCNDKLVSAVFHIDDTIFMLEEYFSCVKRKSLADKTK